MRPARVGDVITKGLAFLKKVQLPNGSFITDSSRTNRPFRAEGQLHITFTPALILGALARVDGAVAIRESLAEWLLTQKSEHWSFNYWALDAPERTLRAYPDDLDDTFCALIGLYLHDPKRVDSAALAHIVKLLLATESRVGGPYRTWLASKDAPEIWQDVDIAVNANIAYFLQLVAEPLPNLTAYMEKVIVAQKYSSPYYPSLHVLEYYLARAYQGQKKSLLLNSILNRQKAGHWETPQQTALALSAFGELGGEKQERAVGYLLDSQQPDGSWPAETFWLDERRGHQNWFAGSSALTTALVLEALARHARTNPTKKITSPVKIADSAEAQSYSDILEEAARQIRQLKQPLRQQGQAVLRRMEQGDTNKEVVLLPYFFAKSLLDQTKPVPNDILVRLGLANLYGWTAYTIYDDFLDNEGDPKLLSVANFALRQSLDCFRQALPEHVAFQEIVTEAFNRMDVANAWEVLHCRFHVRNDTVTIAALPHYGSVIRLAERSVGHTLTPLGVLAAIGVDLKSPAVFRMRKGLEHYLAARQLNDDLHDWQIDVQSGQISYVVSRILQELGSKPGPRPLGALLKQMEGQFWHQTLITLCRDVRSQVALSRKALQRSGLFKPEYNLAALLTRLEDSMDHTLKEQQKAEEFLDAYRRN